MMKKKEEERRTTLKEPKKTKKEMEEEKRQEGLYKSIDSTNKGFAMLQKMGYKAGKRILALVSKFVINF
jgi:G-patch domain